MSGVAEGCRQAGCTLVGGETAEMPGMYENGEYDIAGYTTGVVEKSKLIDGTKVKVGDVLIGISSSGVHSNGYSLVRKIVKDANLDLHKVYQELDIEKTLGEILLTPTMIYVKPVLDVIRQVDVHGVAHITGGGFDENIPRIFLQEQGFHIEEGSWDILPIFRFLEQKGQIPHREMFNIFNIIIIVASINKNSSIIIWDVRQLSLLQIINSNKNDEIINFKWSYFSDHLIEVRTHKEIKLLDIDSKGAISKYEINKKIDFLFLNENALLIFKPISIEKIDIKTQKKVFKINLFYHYIINKNLIQYNYLIILSLVHTLFIYDTLSFYEVKKCDFLIHDYYYFFYPSKNQILCYSFSDISEENVNSCNINFDKYFEKNKNINLDNIKNNFYSIYQKKFLNI